MTEHAAPREDRLELPVLWQRWALPRRANAVRPRLAADPEAAALYEERLAGAPDLLVRARSEERTDRALLARAEAHLDGSPDPAGAAVLADLLDRRDVVSRLAEGRDRPRPKAGRYGERTHLEAWLERGGLAFAVCAAVEELSLRPLHPNRDRSFHSVGYGDPDAGRWGRWAGEARMLHLLRLRLAEAPQEVYDAVAAAVEGHRDTRAKRYAAAVVMPDRHDWVADVLADSLRPSGTKVFDRLAWSMMGTGGHLAMHRRSINPKTFDERSVADLVANLGPAALPVLAATLRFKRLGPTHRHTVLQGVALVPADRAVSVILDDEGGYGAAEAFASVAARFPARTVRVVRARAAAAGAGERARLLGSLKAQPVVAAHLEATEPAAAQEDQVVMPESWEGWALPRRGNAVREACAPDPEAPAREDERLAAAGAVVAAAAEDSPTMAAYARDYLDGEVDPVAAACLAELLDRDHERRCRAERRTGERVPVDLRRESDRIDTWTIRHGLPFAVSAAAAMLGCSLLHRGLRETRGARSGYRLLPWLTGPRLLYTVRARVAEASAEEYAAIVAAVAEHRGNREGRFAAAVVLPDETDWAAEELADPLFHGTAHVDRILWSLVTEPAQVALHRKDVDPATFTRHNVADLVANLGAEALPVLTATLRRKRLPTPARRDVLLGIALLPSDAAVEALLDATGDHGAAQALDAAVARFPDRAERLLTARAAAAEPGERARLLGVLAAAGRGGADTAAPPQARAEDLPRVLVSPPWTEKRANKVPATIAGLAVPEPQVVGRPGEFERALALEPDLVSWGEDYWDAGPSFEDYRTGWRYPDSRLSELARRGPAVADAVVEAVRKHPVHGRVIVPVRSAPAASAAAHWLLRLKAGHAAGLDWFDRHGLHAVPLLLPEAFGPKAYQRVTARGALRLLSWRHGAQAVADRAAQASPEAGEAVAELLDDPLRPLLANPAPGAWADPDRLPPVLLEGGSATLPRTAVAHLVAALTLWAPRVPYPGIESVAAHCDRGSLERFSLALTELWISAGASGDNAWVVLQLGRFGGAGAAALLERHVPRWAARRPELATAGLEALAALPAKHGFPVLYRLSRGDAKPVVREGAALRCAVVADRVGVEVEVLADRLTPAFGLDDPEALVLDYGSRRFRITVDERLNLGAVDAAGKVRPRLPSAGVRDDRDAVAAAKARFQGLGKSLRAEAAFQTARLEEAMLTGRVWSGPDFARLVAHPVLAPIARGLLWLHDDPEGPQGFRLAEDGSFADVHDKSATPPPEAAVRLAHPALLGPDLAAWTEVFTDYAILQPFDQLARSALTLTPEEAESGVLHRFTGAETTFGALLGALEWRRLWWGDERPAWAASAWTHLFSRTLPGGVHLLAEIDPSPDTETPDLQGRHRIAQLWFAPTKNRRRGAAVLRGDAVNPVAVAELLADLVRATGLR
ncbi:DUF4132 domain-containing protein [Glycomyces paridis]|uniref:DUF4132 domain-containing protein n=1 Tax=Glycomyces paridis TaxID=2126555 RepID=A0A4S8PJI8_9ACTN|nr:DUF4132 domain-containing protein [Glycomyces paridis]THV30161.1 DUF4132 domain-containing protein [Glycomyces paridis]